MLPYEQRIVDERDELDVRLDTLEEFINGELFQTLQDVDQVLLSVQCDQMSGYFRTLCRRVARFNGVAHEPNKTT